MAKAPFMGNHRPLIGEVERISDRVEVVTAPNASPMTYTGTRSYILGREHAVVIDPGPENAPHLKALLHALEGRVVEGIFVTHAHLDHSPLAADLREIFQVPVYGCALELAHRRGVSDLGDLEGGEGIDPYFKPDVELSDGDVTRGTGWSLEAIFTPGHLNDHMSFSDGTHLFCGDHVMGWASTMISPPQGNLTDFMNSLNRLLERSEELYLPGHGPVVENGKEVAAYLLAHRKEREAGILAILKGGPASIDEITATLYADVDKALHRAAARNVLAHILDLLERSKVAHEGDFSLSSRFFVTS